MVVERPVLRIIKNPNMLELLGVIESTVAKRHGVSNRECPERLRATFGAWKMQVRVLSP